MTMLQARYRLQLLAEISVGTAVRQQAAIEQRKTDRSRRALRGTR